MSPDTPDAGELKRVLFARVVAQGGAPDDVATATHAACERVYRELTRWVGANGCHALFARALAEARAQHPALADVRVESRSAPALQGVPEGVQAHGAAAVAAGLETLLLALIELLGRLVGNDMTARLLERSGPTHERVAERPT